VDGKSLTGRERIEKGGSDSWLFIAWNGFRPRSPGLDEPVTFGYDTAVEVPDWSTDTGSAVSEGSLARRDSGRAGAASGQASRQGAQSTPPATDRSRQAGFTVQFTAVRSNDAAREVANEIGSSGSTKARVIATERAGVTIYRVIMGPFPTRDQAEKVARATGKPYWIYEGAP
jgi:hypothetical protein